MNRTIAKNSLAALMRCAAWIGCASLIGCAPLIGCNRATNSSGAISAEDQNEAKRIYEQHRQKLTDSIAWSKAEELKWQERLRTVRDTPEYADLAQQYNQFKKDATDTQEKLAEIVKEAKALAGE